MKRCRTQAERLLALDRQIRDGSYPNCSTFAKKWEVSTKTIQRDLEFLKDRMAAPIGYDPVRRGFYYTEPTFMLPAVQMNEGELVALLIGSRALQAFHGTPVAEKIAAVFDKLSALLPDSISLRPEELFTRFSFTAPPSMPISQAVWGKIVQSLLTQRMIEVCYRSWKGEATHRVAPVHLANLQGDWYLFVQFDGFDNFRQIALSRIERVKLLKTPARIEGEFDPQKELSNTFSKFAGDNEPFRVTIQFDADIAQDVASRQWHPKQQVKQMKDGRVEISFEAKGDIEIKRWILAFGRYAKVKSPKWLRDLIADEARAMLDRA